MAIWDAPARAKETAVARPIPLEAPVMKTLRFVWVADAIREYVSVWVLAAKVKPWPR